MTYVIVEQAGYADEQIIGEYPTFKVAFHEMYNLYEVDELDELHVQIMKRLPDGSLTTEF